MQGRRTTWLVGGIGLLCCGFTEIIRQALLGTPGALVFAFLTQGLWAAAVLVFAIGDRTDSSVVARKPLGLTALIVVALWPLLATTVNTATGPQPVVDPGAATVWAYSSLVLPLAAGLVAAMQIARAGAVPTPWNWAPMWTLIGLVAVEALVYIVALTDPTTLQQIAGSLIGVENVRFLIGVLGLGILAIVLATRTRTTVEVFRSKPQ